VSTFLRNLVRRGAGLPAVLPVNPANSTVPAAEFDHGVVENVPSQPDARTREAAPGVAPAPPATTLPLLAASPAGTVTPPIQTASTPAPFVQRFVESSPAPAPAVPGSPARSVDVAPAPVAQARPPQVEPAHIEVVTALAGPQAAPVLSDPYRIPPAAEVALPLPAPPKNRNEPVSDFQPPSRTIGRLHDETRLIERTVETRATETRIATVTIEPLRSAPSAAVASGPPDPPVERIVHVRIGSIEIQGPPTAAGQPAAPNPAPPSSAATPPAGFDEFARLRSYAPWVVR
jgi:hypothetical protein